MACFSTNLKSILLHLMSSLTGCLSSFFQVCLTNLESTLLNAKMCYPPFLQSCMIKYRNVFASSLTLYSKDERGCGERLYVMDLALRIEMIPMATCRSTELVLLLQLKGECKWGKRKKEKLRDGQGGFSCNTLANIVRVLVTTSDTFLHCGSQKCLSVIYTPFQGQYNAWKKTNQDRFHKVQREDLLHES